MAQATCQRPSQAARGDDGKEGRSVRPPRRPLLSMPRLAGARRELGGRPDHAGLSHLRSPTGRQSQAGRDCIGRMGRSLVLTLDQHSGMIKTMKNLFTDELRAAPGRTPESGWKELHRWRGRELSVDSNSTSRIQE